MRRVASLVLLISIPLAFFWLGANLSPLKEGNRHVIISQTGAGSN